MAKWNEPGWGTEFVLGTPGSPMIDYDPDSNTYDDSAFVEANEQGLSIKNFLTALGDFWPTYFDDYENLSNTGTGTFAVISTEYTDLLGMVLRNNITDFSTYVPERFKLYIFSSDVVDDSESEYISFTIEGLEHVDYFVSSLIDPTVSLEDGVHYEILDDEIRFYVDIFSDENILSGAYSTEQGGVLHLVFWGTNSIYTSYELFERFGTFTYELDRNSSGYKLILQALQLFFVNAKSVLGFENIVNILAGVPYARSEGEIVQSITTEGLYEVVVTSKYTYYVPGWATLTVSVDDVLAKFQLLAQGGVASDYISDPDWYDGTILPEVLVVSETLAADFPGDFGGDIIPPYYSISTGSGGKTYQNYLYELVDTILKYNLVYLILRMDWALLGSIGISLSSLYDLIKSGFPVYLYPIIEIIIDNILDDTYLITPNDDDLTIVGTEQFIDIPFPALVYDGAADYDGEFTYTTGPDDDLSFTVLSIGDIYEWEYPTMQIEVASGDDDRTEDRDAGNFLAQSAVSIYSKSTVTTEDYYAGFRFLDVRLPVLNYSLTNATLRLVVSTGQINTNYSYRVRVYAEDDCQAFVDPTALVVTGRSFEAATTGWIPKTTWIAEEIIEIDVTSLMDDILLRGGWASENAVGFAMDVTSTVGDPPVVSFYSKNDNVAGKIPRLDLTLTFP